MEIDISDEKIENLSNSAKSELAKVSKKYAEDVLDEASRIEESRRGTSDSNPEITAAIIDDAVVFAKNYGIRKKKPKKLVFTQVIAAVSSIITGGLFDTDKFKDVGYIIIFLISFLVAVVSTVFLIFYDGRHD